MNVANRPMLEIIELVKQELAVGADAVTLTVGDPDLGAGRHPGARLHVDGQPIIHRPWAVWADLAGRLHLRLATPERVSCTELQIRLERLVDRASPPVADPRTKYGTDSRFAEIHKAEDPSFVLDVSDALTRAVLPERPAVLFLGVNRGDEVALVESLTGRPIDAVGIDHSPSAIAEARRRLPDHRFVEAPLDALVGMEPALFDLVVAIDVLHSPTVDDRSLLHHVVQRRLTPRGAIVIGVPNCRYLDGERLPGARTKNFTQPELSLLVKSVGFYRRYLHQHHFQVFVTGQHEVLVTGVRRPR